MENQLANKAGRILSWLGFLFFFIVFINMLQAPRITIGTEERDIMRNFHIVACHDMKIPHDVSFFCAYGDSRSLKHVYEDYKKE